MNTALESIDCDEAGDPFSNIDGVNSLQIEVGARSSEAGLKPASAAGSRFSGVAK